MFFKRKIKAFAAVALIAALAFSFCACGDSKPSQETYEDVYTAKIDTLAADLGSAYKQVESFNAANMSINLEMGFVLSESLLQLLRSNTSYSFEWVNDTTIKITENMKDDILALTAALAHKGKDIVDGKAIIDTAKGDLYVGVPKLTDLFLKQSGMSDDMGYGMDYGMGYGSTSSIMSGILTSDITAMLPNEKTLASVVKKVFTTFMDNVEVEYDEDTLEINGVSQECVVYEIELSEKQLAKAVLEVIKALADDMAFEKLVTDMVKAAADSGMPIDGTADEAYDELVEELENAAAEIKEAIDEDYVSNETMLTWTSYITGKQEIIGTEIVVEIEGEKTVVFIGSAQNKDEVGTEIYVKQGTQKLFEIDGELTDDGKKLSGTYEIKIAGDSMAFIDLKNVDIKKLESGYFVGSISLSPSKGLLDMIRDEMDFDASVIGLTLGSLSVKLDVTKNDGKEMNGKISLMNGTEEYIAITAKTVQGEGTTVKLPEDTTEDGDEWAQTLDLDKLVKAIQDSDLPDYIKEMASSMPSFSEY